MKNLGTKAQRGTQSAEASIAPAEIHASNFRLPPSAFRLPIRLTLVWLVCCLSLAGCNKTDSGRSADAGTAAEAKGGAQRLIPVTLGLNWFPEVEHGGFYAALVHGYYEQEGLNVEIQPGGPESQVAPQVARQRLTFGVTNADNILFSRAQEMPIVALMAPLQTSPRCLLVHESSGIRDFGDLKNMKLAMSSTAAFAHFLRKKVPMEGVTIVPYSGNVAEFLIDKNYAQQGYVFSEPFTARKQGGDPKLLMLSDLGFNPYTSLLFTSEKVLHERPELARKMVAATVRGWEKYLESPEETNELIHRLNPQMDLDVLAYGAAQMRPLVLDKTTEQHGLGHMDLKRWQTLAEQLIETGQLDAAEVDVQPAFTNEFLPAK